MSAGRQARGATRGVAGACGRRCASSATSGRGPTVTPASGGLPDADASESGSESGRGIPASHGFKSRWRAGYRRSQAGNPPPRGLGTAARAWTKYARAGKFSRWHVHEHGKQSAGVTPGAPTWNRCPEWGNDSEAHATQSYAAGRSARGSRLTWNARRLGGRPGRPPRPPPRPGCGHRHGHGVRRVRVVDSR